MDEDEDAIARIAHQVALLVRQVETARRSVETIDRSAYLLLDTVDRTAVPTIHALADRLQLDVSTMSRQVAALEAKGLLRRTQDPADARVSKLAMTEPGAAALTTARERRRGVFTEMLAEWSVDEREELATSLARLNDAIRARARRLQTRTGNPERP
jgi:DNA-binding MarR family transcriptional regulator